MTGASTQLALIDRAQLTALEQVVERGKGAFIEVGRALMEIRDSRGYRLDGHGSFREYCEKRWHWSDRHGRRMIAAAAFADELEEDESGPSGSAFMPESGPVGPVHIPETEREARQMMRDRRTGPSEPSHPTLASEADERPTFAADRSLWQQPSDPARDAQVRTTVSFVHGLVDLWAVFSRRTHSLLDDYLPEENHQHGTAGLDGLWTSDGLREIANRLIATADEIDSRGAAL